MGKATLARQKAIGQIGAARTDKLYDAGLTVIEAAEYDRLKTELAELKRDNAMLRDIVQDSAQINVVAARIIGEAIKT